MNRFLKQYSLPTLAVLCGIIGMLLRLWLTGTENDQGFIQRGHISEILLVVLSVAFLAAAFLAAFFLKQANKFSYNFPASPAAGAGSGLAALGIGVLGAVDLVASAEMLTSLEALTALVAAVCLAYGGYCRWQGKQPNILAHGGICLWLMLRLICVYRSWSSDPQLEDYCCQLLAMIFAMLAAYQRAAFDADEGHRNRYAFFSLAGIYFCCLCLAGPDGVLAYLSLGIWMITDLCSLVPMPQQFWSEQS